MKKALREKRNLKQTYIPTVDEIRHMRLSADMTQTEAGDAIGVASATWSRYETGIDAMPPAKWRHFTLEAGLIISERIEALRPKTKAEIKAAEDARRAQEEAEQAAALEQLKADWGVYD